ncbi:MAG: SirB2 family protein [Burkholderiales bacterium]|nr:SirB2 family protein [Burkholderiales bacterium]
MDYLVLKTIHMSAVALSVTGFFGRGIGALAGARWVRSRLARTLPHVVDSVLLLSAIALAWRLRLDPLATPWLMAKIIGLLAYIVLGMVALRPGRPWPVRATAWVLALLTFGYIVSVAITKSPAGWLGSFPG